MIYQFKDDFLELPSPIKATAIFQILEVIYLIFSYYFFTNSAVGGQSNIGLGLLFMTQSMVAFVIIFFTTLTIFIFLFSRRSANVGKAVRNLLALVGVMPLLLCLAPLLIILPK